MITREEIEQIALLSRLSLNEETIKKMQIHFNIILDYIEIIKNINTEDINPLIYPLPNFNVLREDKVKESLERKQTLNNAPQSNEKYFIAPKVIEG